MASKPLELIEIMSDAFHIFNIELIYILIAVT